MTNGPGKHDAYAGGHSGSSTQGCASSGAGCHDSSDLRTIHSGRADGCEVSGCHDAVGARPSDKTCGSGGACHTSKTSTSHPNATGGSDTTHTADSGYMATKVDAAGTYQFDCTGCHESVLMSEHTTVGAVTYGTSISCTECHNSTGTGGAANSSVVRRDCRHLERPCAACHTGTRSSGHVTSTPGPHAVNDSTQSVAAGGAYCSSASCHVDFASNVSTAHSEATTMIASVNYDTCSVCHRGGADAPVTDFYTQGAAWDCADCHPEKVDAHGKKHELNLTSSNFDAGTQAGCTNSGDGCHGTSSSTDIADHHQPAAGCQEGVCHTSSGKSTHHEPFVCGDCHDGGYQYALDTTALVDAAPGGHYGVTTHTAGTAQADSTTYYSTACSTCHIMTLGAEHTRTTSVGAATCSACHNDADATAIVTGDWADRDTTGACAACHGVGSIPAAHSGNFTSLHTTSSAGCSASGAGCHNTDNISSSSIHTACTRCHSTTYNPANKTCGNTGGACHNSSYDNSTLVHNGTGGLADGNDATHHTSVLTSSSYTGTNSVDSDGKACSTCHTGTMTTAHTNTRVGSITCSGCHNSSVIATSPLVVKASWSQKLCTNCHNAGATTHGSIESSHTGTGTGCASSGAGCHTTGDLKALHAAKGCTITGCHGVDKEMVGEVKTCGSISGGCHNTYTASNHNGRTGNDTTHTASTSYMQTKVDAAGSLQLDCAGCHISTLGSEHNTVTVDTTVTGGNKSISCTECHNSTGSAGAQNSSVGVIKPGPWNDQCAACHTASRTTGHATSTPGPHAVTDDSSAGQNCSTTCHKNAASNVATFHSEATTDIASVTYNTCNVCHRGSADTSIGALYTKGAGWNCLDCHPTKNVAHMPSHEASQSGLYNGITYADGTNVGCFGGPTNGDNSCHFSDLRLEHMPTAYTLNGEAGANRTLDGSRGSGYSTAGCEMCHIATDSGFSGITPGAYANSTAVRNAVTNGDYRCVTCHNQATDGASGVASAHASAYSATVGSDGNLLPTSISAAPMGTDVEFQDWSAITGWVGGGHNAFAGNSYPNTSTAGAWSGTFQTGWSMSSRVHCNDCHSSGTSAVGPQGASVKYGLAYRTGTTQYAAGYAAGVSPYIYDNVGKTMSGKAGMTFQAPATTTALCGKCHLDVAGQYHDANNSHEDNAAAPCTACHLRIPHAWKRPRLLRRVAGGTVLGQPQDAMPYANPSSTQGVISMGQGAYSGGTCNENYAICNKHHYTTNYWP